MEYKPNIEKIIDYLYDELPEDEQKLMEAYLKNNPEKQREVEDMMGVREVMQKVTEVNPPAEQFTGFRQVSEMDNKLRSWRKIAAVTILLLAGAVAAWVSDLTISTQQNSLVISFGQPQLPVKELPVVEKQVLAEKENNDQEEMQMLLSRYNDSLQIQMQQLQAMISKNRQPLAIPLKNDQYVSKEELAVMLEDMMVENQAFYSSLTNAANQQQQNYYQTVLTNMYQYLNEQRKSDFELMQTMMTSIKLDSDVKIQETENLLTNLIAKIDEENEN